MRKRATKSVIPGFGLTTGITIAMLSVLIIIPLLSILGYSFTLSPEEFFKVITTPSTMRAFGTSIGCAAFFLRWSRNFQTIQRHFFSAMPKGGTSI